MKYVIFSVVTLVAIGAVYFALKKNESETLPAADSTSNVSPTETTIPPSADNPSELTLTGRMVASNYFEYSKADYEAARAAGRPIFLFFYANWCPTCAKQEPIVRALMDEIADESRLNDLIAFRVNFNDNQTDKDEEALAREFGVTYQHTMFVLDETGRQTDKFLSQTSKEVLKSAFQRAVEA
jgi:thiol:disulfide interchange protein